MSKYVITMAQIKGGVAKTTSVINISAALVENNKKVLMIDMDPQGSLSSSFGINQISDGHDITNVLLDGLPIEKAIHKTDIPSLDIIPCGLRMSTEEAIMDLFTNQRINKFPLKEVINNIPPDAYDYIFIDCPSYLGPITVNALISSNLVIIPSSPDPLALQGVKKMIDYSRIIRKHYNPNLKYSILLTIFEDYRKFYSELGERIREIYKNTDQIFSTSISKDINISKSQLMETPVLAFNNKSKASEQYRAVAMEIIARVEKSTEKSNKQMVGV